MNLAKILLTTAATVAVSSSAQAVTLLSLVNPSPQTTDFALTFVATSTSSTLSDGGYNVPSFSQFMYNDVDGGAGNLLGASWTLTPAAQGSDTYTYDDGTSVPALSFGGVAPGYYDVYSQTFATTIGATYTYSFTFTNNTTDSGFFVDVTNATGAVPEPATWAMMLCGLGLVGLATRKRNIRPTVTYA